MKLAINNRFVQYLATILKNNFILYAFLIVANISVLLDIFPFRQIFGFILLIIPGFFILNIFNLKNIGKTERIILSFGLSISFIYFLGFVLSVLLPGLGTTFPLSNQNILMLIDDVLVISSFFTTKNSRFFSCTNYLKKLDYSNRLFLSIPFIFPFLSVVGTLLMNYENVNIVLLLLFLLVVIFIFLLSINHKKVDKNLYPLVIFLISLSLILVWGLRGPHIIGADAHREYFLFINTVENGSWNVIFNISLESCLSITVLPAIFQLVMNTNPESLFKLLFPLLFSISPVVIYLIARNYISDFYSFIAGLGFLAQIIFFQTTENARTNIAILFFALTLLVLLNLDLSKFQISAFFIIFSASCIVSHYSTALIFLFVLLSMSIVLILLPRNRTPFKRPDTYTSNFTLRKSTIYFLIIVIWFGKITPATYSSVKGYLLTMLSRLSDFFVVESRGNPFAVAVGTGEFVRGVPQYTDLLTNWMLILLIGIGVFASIFFLSKNKFLPNPEFTNGNPRFFEFSLLAVICGLILGIGILIPYIFVGYSMQRTLFQVMTVLSLFFVLGGITVSKIAHMNNRYLLSVVVIISLILCNSGFLYQILGYPKLITLNSVGNQFDSFYVYDEESAAAMWLKSTYNTSERILYDSHARELLISQGRLDLIGTNETLHDYYYNGMVTNFNTRRAGYLFLRNVEVRELENHSQSFGLQFLKRSLVYDNSRAEIWK